MSTDTRHTPHYSRVKAQNGAMLSRSSLWLADDHALQITSWGMQENYQRVYFRDIKAVMSNESSLGMTLGFLASFFALILGLAFLITLADWRYGNNPVGIGLLGVFFTIALAATILFFLRGRAVKVYVVTGLQTVMLRSIARKWQLDQLLAQLGPLIRNAQADMIPKTQSSPETAATAQPDQPAQPVANSVV